MGALISTDHLKKVKGFVTAARDTKAKIHCGEGVEPLELPENKTKVHVSLLWRSVDQTEKSCPPSIWKI